MPIQKDYAFICPDCNALVDIKWISNFGYRDLLEDLIWNNCWQNKDTYIYWIPEEVLKEIFTFIYIK
jgi:hypothetical protein